MKNVNRRAFLEKSVKVVGTAALLATSGIIPATNLNAAEKEENKQEKIKTLLLFSHSYFNESKANKALLDFIQANDKEVMVHNLSNIYADYKININAEHALLARAEQIIVQCPVFWYSTPAIFKHWQDEVLTPLYHDRQNNILANKKIGFVFTAGRSEQRFAEFNSPYESALERMVFPLNMCFSSLNSKPQKPFIIFRAGRAENLPFQEYANYVKEFKI